MLLHSGQHACLALLENTDKAHLPEALTHHPLQNDKSLFPTQSLAGDGVRVRGESYTSAA